MKISSSFSYLLLIALITVVMGLIYGTVQQSYRSGLNDPQIQMARDINAELQHGKQVNDLLKADSIDMDNSLSPFVVLYDVSGKPLFTTGFLHGQQPVLPSGLFDVTKNKGEYRVTWQPQKGVRIAMVMVHSTVSPVGFIAVGRSMREVEDRIRNMMVMVFIAWLVCVGLILISAFIQYYAGTKNK